MVDEVPVSEAIDAAYKEAEKVVKKQKTCAAKTSGTLYKLIHCIQACVDRITKTPSEDATAALGELLREVDALDAIAQISADTKDLHGAVAKLGKAVDKGFSTDLCSALRAPPLDRALLDRVVAEHLYQEGAFEVGDAFVAEAGVPSANALKAPYSLMHLILADIRLKNLAPAIEWADTNKVALRGGESKPPSEIEFSLHRLAFLQILEREGQLAALKYARQHFGQFQGTQMSNLKRLMGALCYEKCIPAHSGGGDGVKTPEKKFEKKDFPYADLFSSGILWERLARDFKRQSCALVGQAQDSPLLVTVSAGAAALPTLLKLASLVAKTQPTADIAGQTDQLPVEVPLGREFVFHSIFACPVSREQSSPENPPMMLPCGHCICRQSILRIAKSATRAFKCPYCPMEATMQQCMELHFPEIK